MTDALVGISNDELLRRAVRECRHRASRRGEKHRRWVAVMDTFMLGSTSARRLCEWAGLDPDEEVAR